MIFRFSLIFVIGIMMANTAVPLGAQGFVDTLPEKLLGSDEQTESVDFFLRNNKGWFKSVAFVIYEHGSDKGQIVSMLLLPWQRTKFALPIHSKLYIADADDVKLVKSGGDLRTKPASLTVRADDEGKEYPIFN